MSHLKESEQYIIQPNRSLDERFSSNGHATREKVRRILDIPDPLEGVIEGATRRERYVNFWTDVVAKIWPENSSSGEYGDDLWRSTRYDNGDISGYTQFAPRGRDPRNLTEEEFENVVGNLGTADYVRVRNVPEQLLEKDVTIAPSGGSCAIETWGMKSMADISAAVSDGRLDQSVQSDTARRIVELAPTITHASGAMLSGQDFGIHYVESDMWTQRIASYGMPEEESRQLIDEAYKRINEIVLRRAQLINPTARILNINFDEMPLQQAVESWFAELGIGYDPKTRVAEVIYTYIGPYQKQLLEQALNERLINGALSPSDAQAALNLLHRDFHGRGKQIDHGRWGSMKLPKEVIVDQRDMSSDEREKYDADYPYGTGIRIMQDVHASQHNGSATAVYVGFADLPGPKSLVAHESRDFGVDFKGVAGTPEFAASLEESLTTPARLHRGNVSGHLTYLSTWTQDVQHVRSRLIAEKSALLAELQPIQRAKREDEIKLAAIVRGIEKQSAQVESQKTVLLFINYLQSVDNAGKPDQQQKAIAKTIREQREKLLTTASQKSDSVTTEDLEDLELLPSLIDFLVQVEEGGEKPVPSDVILRALNRLSNGTQKAVERLQLDIEKRRDEQVKYEGKIAGHAQKLDPAKLEKTTQIDAEIKELCVRSYFPLSDNPFIHHAMQFLWDPDFAEFLKQAVSHQKAIAAARSEANQKRIEILAVQNNESIAEAEKAAKPLLDELKRKETEVKRASGEAMRQAMKTIYPKLESYILYLYDKIEYPTHMRNSRVYDSVSTNGIAAR